MGKTETTTIRWECDGCGETAESSEDVGIINWSLLEFSAAGPQVRSASSPGEWLPLETFAYCESCTQRAIKAIDGVRPPARQDDGEGALSSALVHGCRFKNDAVCGATGIFVVVAATKTGSKAITCPACREALGWHQPQAEIVHAMAGSARACSGVFNIVAYGTDHPKGRVTCPDCREALGWDPIDRDQVAGAGLVHINLTPRQPQPLCLWLRPEKPGHNAGSYLIDPLDFTDEGAEIDCPICRERAGWLPLTKP